jgi:PKD repeat protein
MKRAREWCAIGAGLILSMPCAVGAGAAAPPASGAPVAGTRGDSPEFAAADSAPGTRATEMIPTYPADTLIDVPPVAQIEVRQLSSPAFTVCADASRSTDHDATPVAGYRFDFGDGSGAITIHCPTDTLQHNYAAAGAYTVTLVAIDSGGQESSPAASRFTVTGEPVAVHVGYYDTHHHGQLQPKPDPWKGSPGVVFAGSPDGGTSDEWDTSALRVDNLTVGALTIKVTVDIGSEHYALWSARTVPSGGRMILAQTSTENFDGSDTNEAGCYGCSPDLCTTKVSHAVPIVHVTANGITTDYLDAHQVLNTRGVDGAGCPYTGTRNDESHAWERIDPGPAAMAETPWRAAPRVEETRAILGLPVPNPTHGDLAIRFTVPERGAVRLGVYDIAGRMVMQCMDGVLDASEYDMQVRLGDRAPGVYVLALTTPAGTMRRSFVYVR